MSILFFVPFVLTFLYFLIFTAFYNVRTSGISRGIDGAKNQKIKAKLLPLPGMPLIKGVGWLVLFGQRRLVNLLTYIGQSHKVSMHSFWNIRIWFSRMALINDYELGKELFKNPEFCAKPTTYLTKLHSQGLYGLFNTSGKQWKDQRRFCHQHLKDGGFGTKSMESFILQEIDELIQNWVSKKGQTFTPNKSFYVPIFNSLWRILAGERASEEMVQLVFKQYENLQKVTAFPEMLLLFVDIEIQTLVRMVNFIPIFPGIKSFQKGCEDLRVYFQKFINSRKLYRNNNGMERPRDLVDEYLQKILETEDTSSEFFGEKGEMHLLAIMAEFFFAGGDTTANMLAWAMLHLIRNPEIQSKINAELCTKVGPNRRPVLSDRPFCPYTEAFLQEVLRFNPVSPLAMPHTTIGDTNVGPYKVEKGTMLFLNIYKIHHDPQLWTDPQNFRPERFLSEDEKTVSRENAVCAFSFGSRRCLGEQVARDNLFLFVSAICQRFHLKHDPAIKALPTLLDTKSGVHSPQRFSMIAVDRLEENEKRGKV